MQLRPDIDKKKITPERKKGVIGTILIHSAFLLMLIAVAFKPQQPLESGDGGIMVNFGTDETGFGEIEPSPPTGGTEETYIPPPASEKETAPAPTPRRNVEKRTQKEEALLTQNSKDGPEVKKVDPEIEKKRLEKIEADRKIKEQLETERKQKELEVAERKRVEAEQKRQADIINRTRGALANSKNTGTTSTSEGEAGGTGNQGIPTGSVDSKNRGQGGSGTGGSGTGSGSGNGGISYSLGGRGSQSLPAPKYDYQGEGRVVVEVSVDRSGKVIQAIPGIRGSTTLDEYLLKVAKEAALKAKFETKADAPAIQKGTITYNFILR